MRGRWSGTAATPGNVAMISEFLPSYGKGTGCADTLQDTPWGIMIEAKLDQTPGGGGIVRTKRVLLLVALLIIVGAVGYAMTNRSRHTGAGPAPSVEEGGLALNFILKALDGGEVSLEGFRGKAVVVNFWATWCPPCRSEIPDFIEFYNQYRGRGVMVLAVNLREPEDHVRAFAEKAGMDFPVLLDLSGDVAEIYKVQAIPTTIVVDESGVIKSRIVGMTTRDALERVVRPLL